MTTAGDLLRQIEALGAPFGFERSAKLIDGAILYDRCLTSLHRNAFGAEPVRALTQMAGALGAPVRVRDSLPEAARDADVVHFGHESEDGVAVRKLYFEYVSRARAAMARREPVVVHLAYKWRMDETRATAVTRYTWRPCASLASAEARIAERLPRARTPRAHAAAMALLDKAALLARRGELNMLDVEEPGNSRLSLDLNVYDAKLTVTDVGALVAGAGEAFGVALARLDAVFAPARSTALGHLAAGMDRRGREFVTVYFGVEARGS